MGRVVDGDWVSADEELRRDPVAGPLGEKLERRLNRLREDIESGYHANVGSFRERLRARLMAEATGPVIVYWEYTGEGTGQCQMERACAGTPRWVVQRGTGAAATHRVSCERHRP